MRSCNIIFATLQPRTPTAVVNVSHGAFTTAFRLINIPEASGRSRVQFIQSVGLRHGSSLMTLTLRLVKSTSTSAR